VYACARARQLGQSALGSVAGLQSKSAMERMAW
jgi:hypothetical protein